MMGGLSRGWPGPAEATPADTHDGALHAHPQVHAHAGHKAKSASYCGATLHRQLTAGAQSRRSVEQTMGGAAIIINIAGGDTRLVWLLLGRWTIVSQVRLSPDLAWW